MRILKVAANSRIRFKFQAASSLSYHVTLKPTTTAPITGAILASQLGEPAHRTAAPVADEDAALPVADIVPVPVPVPVAVELVLVPEILAGELSLELVSIVPLINHPSSVLFAPGGGV